MWCKFGTFSEWPHDDGSWSMPDNLVTAAKIKTYYPLEVLNSGECLIVALLNAGTKQIGKLKTFYLCTGAYTDKIAEEHNVARTIPMCPVEPGSRGLPFKWSESARSHLLPGAL